MEVGFLKRGLEIAEQFSTDEMVATFIRAHTGKVFGEGENLIFDFHGQNLRAVVTSFSIVDLPGGGGGSNMGILMDKTDVTFVKAADSLIKLKGSSKKYVHYREDHESHSLLSIELPLMLYLLRISSSKIWVSEDWITNSVQFFVAHLHPVYSLLALSRS